MQTRSILLFGLFASCGCTPSSIENEDGPLDTASEVHFERATLYFPQGSDQQNPAHLLAPIIVHESGKDAQTDLSGWLDAAGGNPRVYLARSEIEINGVIHSQFIYSWRYGKKSPQQPALSMGRILRMTLDSRGYPAVYEVFTGKGVLVALHVSLGLEQSAEREHGPPLPGRKYSIERAPQESTGTVLAGVVKEGPVAMGPLAYLDSPARKIVALTCRCSPSRIEKADGSHRYELIELERGQGEAPGDLPPTGQALGNLRFPGEF